MGNKHVISDLYQMQSLSLRAKISMTKRRINEWVDMYGEDGVYVSFSGGKDSTVLLDIARQLYPNIKAVFVDTGLEYPEIRLFVKTVSNVDWIRPKLTFRQVIEKYGYPFISKEVSECVDAARKYLTRIEAEQNTLTDRILMDDKFFEHLHLKRLVTDNNIPYPMSTFERMLRYAKYGYFPCKETKLRIVEALRELTDEQIYASESLYDGMD